MQIKKIVTYITSKIKADPLFSSILILGGGTAVSQIITVAASPILTRLYTPSDFGLFGLYGSILTILIIIASLRYEFALPIPTDDSKACNLLIVCLGLVTIITLLFTLSLIIFGEFFFKTIHSEIIIPYFGILIISFFGAGIYQVLNYWAIRYRLYKEITYTKINQGISGPIVKIVLGLMSFGPFGLLIGDLISRVAGAGTFIRMLSKQKVQIIEKVSIKGIKSVLTEFRSFPFYSVPASFFHGIAIQIPIFMLSAVYSLQAVGFYTLAWSMMVVPTQLISISLKQAYYGEASSIFRKTPQKLYSFYIETVKKLLKIGIPLVFILSISAPLLFPIIFGEIWKDAGYYCIPLGLVVISRIVTTPTSTLQICGYNHWQLGYDIIQMILIIAGFVISLNYTLSVMEILFIYGSIMSIMGIFLFILNLIAIRKVHT